jgi:hypothetical protein
MFGLELASTPPAPSQAEPTQAVGKPRAKAKAKTKTATKTATKKVRANVPATVVTKTPVEARKTRGALRG